MRHLRFLSESGEVDVTLKTDMVTPTASTFHITYVYGMDDFDADNPAWKRHKYIANAFNIVSGGPIASMGPYSIKDAIEVAEVHGLELTIADELGSNATVLVTYSDSDSES